MSAVHQWASALTVMKSKTVIDSDFTSQMIRFCFGDQSLVVNGSQEEIQQQVFPEPIECNILFHII